MNRFDKRLTRPEANLGQRHTNIVSAYPKGHPLYGDPGWPEKWLKAHCGKEKDQ